MPDTLTPTSPATPEPKLTPADFQLAADTFNARVTENAQARAQVQAGADKINADREVLIGRAGSYGVTGKFARASLRKG